MILDEMKKEHARQRRHGAVSYTAGAWENGTPSWWLQFSRECGADVPQLRTLQDTRRAARSADPVTVVAAVVHAASGRHDWTSDTRDRVICEAVRNDACPDTVRLFALRCWGLGGKHPLQPKPTKPAILARCERRALVHVAEWGRDRSEVVLACEGVPAKWAGRWEGAHAAGVEVTCKACRRMLAAGRCHRPS
jgi:hypothetical protein